MAQIRANSITGNYAVGIVYLAGYVMTTSNNVTIGALSPWQWAIIG